MDVLVTGAYGRCGTALIDHLHDRPSFEFSYFNRSDRDSGHPYGGYDTIVGDVTDFEALQTAMIDRDALVHLAAYPYTSGSWSDVLDPNIVGMYNALEAARQSGVETVVFGSTNHVQGMYEQDLAPEIYYPGHGVSLDRTDPIRPDSYYGSTKAFGEAICRQYADTEGPPHRVYVLRICTVNMPEYDHPYGNAEQLIDSGEIRRDEEAYDRAVARMKAMWHSRRDFAQLVERCLTDETVEYGIFNGVSDNDRRWFSIEHARATLGYRPRDNAEPWDGPPTRNSSPQ